MRASDHTEIYNEALKRALARGVDLPVAKAIAKANVQAQREREIIGSMTTCVWDNAT